ncbi:hypothetical protein VNO80_29004 [Phaseolus coccineus]|uniref:RING-type domain-containing protein n=1 Tax=Phaseolus coccineus TaxID=3886 RepID=A0AAN9QC08_PHACN
MSIDLLTLPSEVFIFFSCLLVLLLVWYWIAWLILADEEEEEESREIGGDIESGAAHTSLPQTRNASFFIANARGGIAPWHRILFTPKMHIANLAVRAMPPVIPFQEDQTTRSQTHCPICLLQFTNGDLIQPFGLCFHEFHPSCIHSWLLHGKTSCPVCRMELPITLHH